MMIAAKEGRKNLRELRLGVEATKKKVKEEAINYGRTIDSISNTLKSLIEPMEDYLEKQEKYVEIKKTEEKRRLTDARLELIKKYIPLPCFEYDFGNMTEEVFQLLLTKKRIDYEDRVAYEAQQEARRKAEIEAERIEKERLETENKKLREEAAKHEKEISTERLKHEKINAEIKVEERRRMDEAIALERKKWESVESKRTELDKNIPQSGNGNGNGTTMRITCPHCQKQIVIRSK
jgi:hypothetical protein